MSETQIRRPDQWTPHTPSSHPPTVHLHHVSLILSSYRCDCRPSHCFECPNPMASNGIEFNPIRCKDGRRLVPRSEESKGMRGGTIERGKRRKEHTRHQTVIRDGEEDSTPNVGLSCHSLDRLSHLSCASANSKNVSESGRSN